MIGGRLQLWKSIKKVVFHESFINGWLISWLVDFNENPKALLLIQLCSLTYKSGLKMLFGQTNNKLSQFSSIMVKRSSSQGINEIRPYLIIGWLKHKSENTVTHQTKVWPIKVVLKFDLGKRITSHLIFFYNGVNIRKLR